MPATPAGVRGATITGWGTAVPPKVLTNKDLEEMFETSDEWIIERTGIHERRVGGTTTGLSIESGRKALEMSGVDLSEVDALVLATTTPDRTVPASSPGVAVRARVALRRRSTSTRRAPVSPTGSSWHTASSRWARRRCSCIGTDTLARITDWTDRNTAILFADGSGAVMLEASDGPRAAARLGPRRRRLGRAIPLLRDRRQHPDGGQGGLPPRGADHGRLRAEVDEGTPASPPTSSRSSSRTRRTSGSSRPRASASACRWSAPPPCSHHTGNTSSASIPLALAARSTTAASRTATSCCWSASAPA